MALKKKIDREIIDVTALGLLTDVYGEIASTRMKKTRQEVLTPRDFLLSVYSVFQEVFTSYRREVMRLARKKGVDTMQGLTLLSHNGKSVGLLLSANTGLYGDVIKKSFDFFLDDIKKSDVEVTIVGRLGRGLFIEEEPSRPYTYFDLPDVGTDKSELSLLVRHLVQYEEIHIYFRQFRNVILQEPTKLVISAKTVLTDLEKGPQGGESKYMFEPTMEQILMFFETEIFASLIDQAVRESQLSKFASRVLAMDRAQVNIKDDLRRLHIVKLRSMHREQNRKQLGLMSGVSSWGS